MKKATSKHPKAVKDLRAEYDFTGGVRGKPAHALRQGYTIEIHHPDGTLVLEEVQPAEGVIILDSDVREHFPDSQAVNETLRALVKLIPGQKKNCNKKILTSYPIYLIPAI